MTCKQALLPWHLAVLALVLAAMLALLRTDLGVAAPPAQAPDTAQGPAAPGLALSYQARLLDPATGTARNGPFALTFRLYDTATGGTPLWTEAKNINVTTGLFTTLLGDTSPLNLAVFDGRDLWLGVTVGTDLEATPRQAIAYTPYALYSRNAALFDGKQAGAFAAAGHTHDGSQIASGIVAEPRIDAAIARDSEIMSKVLASDGAGSGLDADTVDGTHSNSFAAASHTHDGSQIASGIVAEPRIDAAIARDSEIMPKVLTSDGAGSGLDADTVDGLHSGNFAPTVHDHFGQAWAGNRSDYGLQITNSDTGDGIRGYSSATALNYGGVYGECRSSGTGVAGVSTSGFGGYFSSGNDHYDLALGGSIGRINSDPRNENSNLILSSNNDVEIRLDNDGGEVSSFWIMGSAYAACQVSEEGNLYCWGTKSGVVETPSSGPRVLYAMESPEVWFEDFGTATLVDGAATVSLDPVFGETISLTEDYHVFLTPLGDCHGLYVAGKTAGGFEVRELQGGTANISFDYRIAARRRGYEGVRLPEGPVQTSPSNPEGPAPREAVK